MRNRSVPADTVLPHVVYQNLAEAIAWLERVFRFSEHYRYGDGPSGAQMFAGKAAIQVSQARPGQQHRDAVSSFFPSMITWAEAIPVGLGEWVHT
jgi:hypothetical protein